MPRSRPTREDQAASRAHRRGQARRSTGGPSIVTLRMAELYRVFNHRYGGAPLPDDDSGRDDLRVAFQTLSTSGKAAERMAGVARTWAPWMPADELTSLIADAVANPRRFKADTIAARLGITMEIRTLLNLRTIGATDVTAEQRKEDRREAARLAKEHERRAAGKLTVAQIRARCAAKPRPWRDAGIDRSTWYRQRQREVARQGTATIHSVSIH
jgi:hypothetical protein